MKFFRFLFLYIGLATAVEAQNWEFGLYHQRGGRLDSLNNVAKSANNYIDTWAKVYGGAGVWGFAFQEKGYSSIVGGVYYDFTSWFELGLGAGSENYSTGERGERYAAFISLFSGRTCTLEAYYERGREVESPWYQGDLMCRPLESLGLGIFSQSGVGTGPRLLLTPTDKLPLQIWVSPYMYDQGTKTSNGALGVQIVLRGKK